jgi:hypothetical protein
MCSAEPGRPQPSTIGLLSLCIGALLVLHLVTT